MPDDQTHRAPGGGWRVSRRTFLKQAGAGAAALSAGYPLHADPPQARTTTERSPSTGNGGAYRLENGFFSISGAYGKLAEVQVNPRPHLGPRPRYESPAAFTDVYLGELDIFNQETNQGVTWRVTRHSLQLSNIATAGPPISIGQGSNNGAPPPLTSGHTYGQSFTMTGAWLDRVTLLLATFGSTTSASRVTLYRGRPGQPLTKVTSESLAPMTDNTTYTLQFPAQPAGTYYLEVAYEAGTPTWWFHRGSHLADVGGQAYFDGAAQPGLNFIFTATGYDVGPTAIWEFDLQGPRLQSTYRLAAASHSVEDSGFSLVSSWKREGYSVAYADGVLFSRFFTDTGRYMPAEQLKRRDNWGGVTLTGDHWVYATGSGSYDLRLSSPTGVGMSGPIGHNDMTWQLAGIPGQHLDDVAHTFALEVLPHTGTLPDIFPVFVSSDASRARETTTFYHERALSWPFSYPSQTGTYGADWLDWMARILAWTGTKGSPGVGDALQGISLDPDGYVWTWNPPGQRGWPFPSPSKYDTRHFTTNAMYLLGAWRYYSWTGDRVFLTKMMPRLRSALGYYLDVLGGASGLITIASPDHSAQWGMLGSNYWDITAFGYQSAYENAYFYAALEAMAELEEHVGNSGQANVLRALRVTVRDRYNQAFWSEAKGRYIETIDRDGNRHDYGSSFVNLEAAALGLPTRRQGQRIFDWLDHGRTELTTVGTDLRPGAGASSLSAGHTAGQSFTTSASFSTVAGYFMAASTADGGFTLALYEGDPTGRKLAERHVTWLWPGGYAPLDVGVQPAGRYYLQASDPTGGISWADGTAYSGGNPYVDGVVVSDIPSRALVSVSPAIPGPADIYDQWVFAPRTTTRKNDFWYFSGWEGVIVPWQTQLQDGGADLYQSGFDVIARSRLLSSDDAWQRWVTVLDRWSKPDHLCGGSPLYDGEIPQNEQGSGSVGVDIPFPESGLAPASFLSAFLGIEATPDALEVAPNLPAALEHAGVRNLWWRGRKLDITVTQDAVVLKGQGVSEHRRYQKGETLRFPARS